MAAEDLSLDISELADQAGVTPRTVRYYVQQGLLPAPGQRGPGSHYTQGHLDRLRLIRELQRHHLPLAEIRRQLEGMDDEAVAEALRGSEVPGPSSPALDYIRGVRGEPVPSVAEPAPRFQSEPPAVPSERSTWERMTLAEDIELHVRRPLSRSENRRLERLIEAARRIFGENEY